MATPPNSPHDDPLESKLKIYFLPNLLTAGNLFCGFVALTKSWRRTSSGFCQSWRAAMSHERNVEGLKASAGKRRQEMGGS